MQILGFFMDVEGEPPWALVENKGRSCYWNPKTELDFDADRNIMSPELILLKSGFDPAKLPHIEDMDPVLQQLWREITMSENNMWFVEYDEAPWNDFGISREEYELRIDTLIEKYDLQDVITKNEDDCLYTCYGNLQSKFSEPYTGDTSDMTVMERVASILDVCLYHPFRIKQERTGIETIAQFRDNGLYLYIPSLDGWTLNHTWLAELLAEKIIVLD